MTGRTWPGPARWQRDARFAEENGIIAGRPSLTNAEAIGSEVLSLPFYPPMSRESVQSVVTALRQTIENVG
ncbi:MAG: hypothetical protein EPO27_16190 [Betaproteobacteria bacterium]|nr:MAG: hypothetical protein EPO27_16190 [Betaproteobacteria bacterium]